MKGICCFNEKLFDLHKFTSDLGQTGKLTIVVYLVLRIAWVRESYGEERGAVIGAKDDCLHVELYRQLCELCLVKSIYNTFTCDERILLNF